MFDRKLVLEGLNNKEFFKNVVEPNIEKYRKDDFELEVKDRGGNLVTDAKIRVCQRTHEFKFGANIFMLDELETDEKNEQYKKYFKDVFNMATLPFYWNSLEPEKGKCRYDKDSPKWYRRPPIDLCMAFCRENGIEPREHALAYERCFPVWLKNASVESIKNELERRYKEIAERYADEIRTIEVTNEMEWYESTTAFYNEPNYIEWCFKRADEYFPHNELVINEATEACWGDRCRVTDKYYAYTEAAKLKGCRIDAVGMQFHMFYDRAAELEKSSWLYNARALYNHMDLYSRLADNLQVTEITIPAYSNDASDEEIQADIIEKLYSIWFSHPKMEQIIYWNLVDGYAYVPDPSPEAIRRTQGNMTIGENQYYGGLLRFDLTPKPAYHRIKELLQKRWHTEGTYVIDENGKVNIRGFYGDYELEISCGNKVIKSEFSISKDKENKLTITI